MRKLSLFFAILISSTFCIAQSSQISESKETMKLGTFNALTVDMPNVSDKVALKVWKEYIKGYGPKAKKVKKSKEILSSGAIIGGINSSDPLDIYAKIEDQSNGSKLTVWFNMGEFYVSSGSFPSDYTAAEKFLKGYNREVAKELVVMELEDAEKKMKKMEKEMKNLKKKNDDYHKDIEKAKKAIAKAENNIEENEKKQKEQTSLISDQSKAVEAIKEKLSEM